MPVRFAIGVAPDLGTHGQEAVRLAVGERRIRKDRRRDRLQCKRHPQLLHHVGFGFVIHVHLHGRRAVHHVETELADFRHVVGHDAIARLGHHGRFCARPERAHAEGQKPRCPSFSATAFASRRCWAVSVTVSCMKGVQERRTARIVRRARARWRRRRLRRTNRSDGRPRGWAPSRCVPCKPSSNARMPFAPSYGTGAAPAV